MYQSKVDKKQGQTNKTNISQVDTLQNLSMSQYLIISVCHCSSKGRFQKNKYCSGSVKLRVCVLHLYLYQANIVFPYFQLRQQLYKSQCWSVCRSVCQQRVLQKCYAFGNVYMLLLLLQLRISDHSVAIFCIC